MLQRHQLLEYTTKPLPLVHIGIIGLGNRGLKTVDRYALVPGAEIVALADFLPECTAQANEILASSGRPRAKEYVGVEGHKDIVNNPDIDIIYICTDWKSHAQIAVMAMRSGKHVAIEVPAAMTLVDCEMLINVSLETHRHCIMLENCCYDTFASATRVMVKQGLLGDITHCEGAYMHDLTNEVEERGGLKKYWMARETMAQPGNAYPTHSLGPIGLQMNLHRGDRMDYLVSMTSQGNGLHGRVNNTLIHTHLGRTILLQHDIGTPRPYSRLQTTCGTNGFTQKYPVPTIQLDGMTGAIEGDEAMLRCQDFREEGISEWVDDGINKKSSNVMNHVMDCRLVYCLQNGLPLDMDVFDAAEWSAVIELSNLSAAQGSRPIEIPDFTGGNWDTLESHKFYI